MLFVRRTFKKGCPFQISIEVAEDKRHLRVKSVKDRHENHEVSPVGLVILLHVFVSDEKRHTNLV